MPFSIEEPKGSKVKATTQKKVKSLCLNICTRASLRDPQRNKGKDEKESNHGSKEEG